MTTVAIGLGSNIAPESHLRQAAAMLRKRWPSLRFSPVYRTKAMGYEDQEDFLNAVGMVDTDDTPEEIHTVLKDIETELKKAPPFKNGPRTIDLDLLLYGNEQLEIRNSELIIPHPRMHGRRFVLQPLVDLGIAGDHPKAKETWEALLKTVEHQEITRTDLIL